MMERGRRARGEKVMGNVISSYFKIQDSINHILKKLGIYLIDLASFDFVY